MQVNLISPVLFLWVANEETNLGSPRPLVSPWLTGPLFVWAGASRVWRNRIAEYETVGTKVCL